MQQGALAPYEAALAVAEPLSLVSSDGHVIPLDIARYVGAATAADMTVLDRCVAPVLDVGCGPGRIVHALAASGRPALGVDIAHTAVAMATQRGGVALTRSVFEHLPGQGRWPTILVLDGNVGIGGDVCALLLRLRHAMSPSGVLIVEASTQRRGVDDVLEVRFHDGAEPLGPAFLWAVVSVDTLGAHCARAGLRVADQWSAEDRTFLRLVRSTATR